MTKLSININKVATLRNARGEDQPNLLHFAKKCIDYGADGITVHPRPDERHIKYSDVYQLKHKLKTELNIEGNPKEQKFVDLVTDIKPTQVTLVPDANNQLTSNHGWDCKHHLHFLQTLIAHFKHHKIRTSIFLDPDTTQIEYAKLTGADRVELYTKEYADNYVIDKDRAISRYSNTAKMAIQHGLAVNAGHDLNCENLTFFLQQIKGISEVSIGHAFITDCLYHGLKETMRQYKSCININ